MSEQNKTDELLALAPFDGSPECNILFLEALKEELMFHYDNNELYRQFCNRKNFNPYYSINSLSDIPAVSVSVFKELGFKLSSVPKEDLTLTLQSSATSGIPSTVMLDKLTNKRQAKAMVKVISNFIGNEKKPFIIMDIDPLSAERSLLGARTAAVTGYMKFASKTGFFLKPNSQGIVHVDVENLKLFLSSIPTNQSVVLFGFTYILYQNVVKTFQKSGIKIQLPYGSKIIHIGGWKKLENEKVEKNLFNTHLAEVFGIDPIDIIDIYGFTEQMGLNYPDCQCGFKHESSYARIIVRDPVSHEILPDGDAGMMEFITPIPHSYPGNIVLTDDIGFIDRTLCPFGRSGKRFKIIGRMKKAEVRGCGDILSEKLTFFQKKDDTIGISNNLDIQFFKGKIEGKEIEVQLQSIIDSLNSHNEWLRSQPIEALIGLIGLVSKKWISDPKYLFLKDKGLLFLSQWCEGNHLTQVAENGLNGNLRYADNFLPFPDNEKHLMMANSRGLVCHWMAGNVQILGMFALVQCILTKNVNLIKVAAKDGGVFVSLISAFEGLKYSTSSGHTIFGDELLKTIAVVYFSRQDNILGELMSKCAKVRIAWGGKEAVETVASYPSQIDCETVIFGPKLSFAVIAKEELSSEQEAKKLARRVSVDVSVFDQEGCASPHNLYIERGGNISPEEFCQILAESFPKTEIQIPKANTSTEQISAIHSVRGIYDFKGKIWGSDNLSWTILLSDKNDIELCKPVYSRTLMVHEVNSINDTLSFIEDYIQTIGIAAPRDKAIDFATKATAMGVSRCPQIGRMLNFEMPWDGIFLINKLVRWNTLFGPLR